jgi:cyclophilin family peptidyl-prolyl cis-trans isomerase
MGTDKRDRKKANRAAKLEAERAAEARARRNRTIRNAVVAGIAIVVVMLLATALSGCGSQGSEGAGDASTDAASSDATTPEGTTSEGTSGPDADEGPEGSGAATYGTGECPPAEGVDEPVIDFDDAPQQCIDPAKTYTATVETTLGTVVVELDAERTPVTTNNFVTLARYGYFDGTDLFRTEAASGIIQGGSPHTQSNTDPGPGYTIPDEGLPFLADDYGPGTLAMARTAAPNSASGQFFFLATEGGRYLGDPAQLGESAGSYAVFGTVTEGLDVLEQIAALDDGTGVPSEQVAIESVTITES